MTFYEQRVAGAKDKIAKLEKKLERIRTALETGKNPYYYDESDLRYTTKELDEAKKSLTTYEAKVAEEKVSADTKVPAIDQFLDNWKEKAIEWYIQDAARYHELLERQKEEDAEDEKVNGRNYFNRELYRKHKDQRNVYNVVTREVYSKKIGKADVQVLTAIIEKEKIRKRKVLIDKVKEITGTITDGCYLSVVNGDLNGYITGEQGKAEVRTISAGGYNIQCFHYRMLVKKLK